MALMVQRSCVWCLVIVAIFMVFGQAREKKVWGMLKSHRLGVAMQVTKSGALFIGKAGSHYVKLLYCEAFLSYWVYIAKDFIGYLFSLYYCCFTCLRLTKPKVQVKMS